MADDRALLSAEECGVQKALDAVDEIKNKLQREGFSKISFSLGVINVSVTSMILVGLPAYFWVWYCLKCVLLIPAWIISVSRNHSGALWALDYCWVMNITFGVTYTVIVFFDGMPEWFQKSLFLTFFASAMGPLGWACLLLQNGLVLHSVERLTSLFIHMSPTVTCWTIMRFNDDVQRLWPGRFPKRDQIATVTFSDLYVHGFGVYIIWLVIHGVWLLAVGVDCPKKGKNTVFDGLYQPNREFFSKHTRSDKIRAHASLYLVIHCAAVALAFVWPPLCWNVEMVHIAFGVAIFLSAVWNGASYYEYLLMKNTPKALKKLIERKESFRQ